MKAEETNQKTEEQSQRKAAANKIVEEIATEFGVPKTAVYEYAIVLLDTLRKNAPLYRSCRMKKEPMRFSTKLEKLPS